MLRIQFGTRQAKSCDDAITQARETVAANPDDQRSNFELGLAWMVKELQEYARERGMIVSGRLQIEWDDSA